MHEYSTTVHIWGVSVQSQSTWVLNYSSHPESFSPTTKYKQVKQGSLSVEDHMRTPLTTWGSHLPVNRQTDRQAWLKTLPSWNPTGLTDVCASMLVTDIFIFTTIEMTVYMLIASTYCWIFGAFHVWTKPVNGVFPKFVLANWVNWANLEKWSCVVEWPPVILVVVQPIGFLLQVVCLINYYL